MNELFIYCHILVELILPGTLEIDGIEQITERRRIEFVLFQHFLNHTLSTVAGPLVDDITGLAVRETAALRLCLIESLSCCYKCGKQMASPIRVNINIVGNHHLRLFVEG